MLFNFMINIYLVDFFNNLVFPFNTPLYYPYFSSLSWECRIARIADNNIILIIYPGTIQLNYCFIIKYNNSF